MEEAICPGCGWVLIRRNGLTVLTNRVQNGRCLDCETSIAGVGMAN